jgi:hypothetical protein
VATSLAVCEGCDRKGLYAKTRAGIVKEFTGISDPYEVPEKPEFTINTSGISVDEAVQRILLKLEHEGYLRSSATGTPNVKFSDNAKTTSDRSLKIVLLAVVGIWK